MATAPRQTRTSRSDQRQQTRERILEAVLTIAVSDGMRAVRHRAVAEQAGVSLGSTTYHFSSIEELIISAFDFWRSRRQLVDNPFYLKIVDLLAPFGESAIEEARRPALAEEILALSIGYLIDQVTTHREDRIIELAFYHESMRYASLRQLVLEGWAAQQDFLEQLHRRMGSSCPVEDATITSMLFHQWEQRAVMLPPESLDVAAIRASLRRHLSLSLGEALPGGRA